MIARIVIYLLLLILLPDWYLDYRYIAKLSHGKWLRRFLLWLPSLGMAIYTLYEAREPDFEPLDVWHLYVYLMFIGLFTVPKFIFAFFSFVGWLSCRMLNKRVNWGNLIGLLLVPVFWSLFIYGTFVGFYEFNIRPLVVHTPALPRSFSGYKIVHVSDLHVGSYVGSKKAHIQRVVDSINAQHADLVVFTGDLINVHPQELYPYQHILSQIKAKDGVVSILGNHDYADYITASATKKATNCREIIRMQHYFGWQVLTNSHLTIYRGNDSIMIAGVENDNVRHHTVPRSDITQAMQGIHPQDYTVLLMHDPTTWHTIINRYGQIWLTLSGHTHGGQLGVFGWSPASLKYKEWGFDYYASQRVLNVSVGVGGLVPFRLGMPGEITVITLMR